MYKIILHGVFVILTLIFLLSPELIALAGDKEALEYFKKGEYYFNKSQYDDALKWYEKAIKERASDGAIEFKKEKVTLIPYGRSVEKKVEYSSTYEDYYPNKQIEKIKRGGLPPQLALELNFIEPSKNNILDADETGTLTITVKNSGKGDAYDVSLAISCPDDKGLTFEKSIFIGDIKPNDFVKKEINISASRNIGTKKLQFDIKAKEMKGFDADAVVKLEAQEYLPPNVIVADFGINDLTGDSKIEPSETVELTARIQNIGRGTAHNVSALVEKSENVFALADNKDSFSLGKLASGETRDIKFSFYTNKRIGNGEKIPLSIKLAEQEGKYGSEKDLKLVMNASQKSSTELVIAGQKMEGIPIAIAGGLSVDVDIDIPIGKTKNKDAVAVIIGNKSYTTPGVPPVEFAYSDAEIMKEYLIKAMGYSEKNIIFEKNATMGKLSEIFGTDKSHKGKLFNFVKPGESDVFIYYVGHGAPDVKTEGAYLVPVDADPNYIVNGGYSLETFYKNISKIPARSITVVLDSCFSGGSAKGMLLRNISPLSVSVETPETILTSRASTIVMTSADKGEVSSWYSEKHHSLFTYFFLKGLKGEADKNKDKKITVSEIRDYINENVPYSARRETGQEQNPRITLSPDAKPEKMLLVEY